MDKILMLNAACFPLGLVSWTRAVCLLLSGKAEALEFGDRVVRSPSTEMVLPSILRLKENAKFPKRRIRLNRRNLLARDDYTCQYCGARRPSSGLNMDHVIPRSQGGPTRWENVVASCIPCNDDKGGRTPREAGMRLLRAPTIPNWTAAQEIAKVSRKVPDSWRIYLPQKK